MSKQLARALNGCSLEEEPRNSEGQFWGIKALETSQNSWFFHEEMGALKADLAV